MSRRWQFMLGVAAASQHLCRGSSKYKELVCIFILDNLVLYGEFV